MNRALVLLLSMAAQAEAAIWLGVNGRRIEAGGAVWLNSGDTTVLQICGDGITPLPLEAYLYVEGPGRIDGHELLYLGDQSRYQDLEELAQAMGLTADEVLAVMGPGSSTKLTDLARFVLDDSGVPPRPTVGVLIDEIIYTCQGEGDVRLRLETNSPSSTFVDYTVVIHQAVYGRYLYVDAAGGSDLATGLSPGMALATIQKAIDTVPDGGTVVVFPGTYRGPGNRDLDFKGKAITVRSSEPNDPTVVARTVIDCQGTAQDRHRGFYFHDNEAADSVVDGLTITNGYAPLEQIGHGWASVGGGICCLDASPTIRNCLVVNNRVGGGDPARQADGGSGICGCGGPVINSTVAGNSSEPAGGKGAIYRCDGPVTNCVIRDNRSCGGLYDCQGPVSGCIIENNSRDGSVGGGLAFCYGRISRCVIRGNSAGFGGGIGALPVSDAGGVVNCVISGNTAGLGGGLYNYAGAVTNCTIVGNRALSGQGGAMFGSSGVSSCILVANIGPSVASDCTYSYCDEPCWSPGAEGNMLGSDPAFVSQGYWNANGTPQDINDDFWVEGDYHLRSRAGRWDAAAKIWAYDADTSPCIDAGNPGSALRAEPNDPSNQRINMGVYGGTAEASRTPPGWSLAADLTNDGLVDSRDLAVQARYWRATAEQMPGDLTRDGAVDAGDLAELANSWLETTGR